MYAIRSYYAGKAHRPRRFFVICFPGSDHGAPDEKRRAGIDSGSFRSLVLGYFLEGLPDGLVADEALFIGFHLASNDEARLAVRNLSYNFV